MTHEITTSETWILKWSCVIAVFSWIMTEFRYKITLSGRRSLSYRNQSVILNGVICNFLALKFSSTENSLFVLWKEEAAAPIISIPEAYLGPIRTSTTKCFCGKSSSVDVILSSKYASE